MVIELSVCLEMNLSFSSYTIHEAVFCSRLLVAEFTGIIRSEVTITPRFSAKEKSNQLGAV